MRLSYRMAANVFESAERAGVPREALTEPLGLDARELVQPSSGIDWDTLVAILDQLMRALGGEVERLREVGRKMVGVPSFQPLRRLGRAVVSLERLYVAGERWIAPANVPHLVVRTSFPSVDRLVFRCAIPEPYVASEPYLIVFEGLVCAIPTILGLPLATILTSKRTSRELDMLVALPPSGSIVARARRVVRAAVLGADAATIFEGQRREIAEALEATKRSTAEIVTLFDRLPDLVIIHRAGMVVWVNRAAFRAFGYDDSSEVVGQSLKDLFHSSSRALANERSHGIIGGDAPDLAPAELVGRRGDRVLVELSPAEHVSFGGRDARLLVARDVTERSRLREQLSVADRLASVGMLAAGVAHEVNNPLAYVLNNIEIAHRELASLGTPADASRAALTVALEGVDRIRTIIRDLLALARNDDDAIGEVDATSIVESTLALAKPEIEGRATLVCALAATPLVRGTVSRIGQVVLNLVANAVEAMSPERRETNVLRVAVGPIEGGAVIEVSDTGNGIATGHAARVFEPFFTTKSLGRGTGLGLAISQRLVAEMGGEIAFESTEGVGTVFCVRLRTAEDGPPTPVRPSTY